MIGVQLQSSTKLSILRETCGCILSSEVLGRFWPQAWIPLVFEYREFDLRTLLRSCVWKIEEEVALRKLISVVLDDWRACNHPQFLCNFVIVRDATKIISQEMFDFEFSMVQLWKKSSLKNRIETTKKRWIFVSQFSSVNFLRVFSFRFLSSLGARLVNFALFESRSHR